MSEPLPVTLGRTLLAQFFVAGTAYAAYVFASSLMGGEPRIARWVGVVVSGCFLATLGFHLLTWRHAFAWAPATACVALMCGLAFVLERRTSAARASLRSDRRFLRRAFARFKSSRLRVPSSIVLATFVPTALRPLVTPTLAHDGLTYHGLKAAMPVQTGAVARLWAPGQWSYAGPVWGGHEALGSWAMLPFHADVLSPFAEVVQLLALALSLFGLAREARVEEPLGSYTVAAALSVPTLHMYVGTAYVETGAMMALSAGLLLLVRGFRGGGPGTLLLASAALGLCAGMKLNMLPMTCVLSLGVVACALRTRLRRALLTLTLAASAFLASVVPWLVYGTQLAGAPLSPLPVRIAGVSLGIAPPEILAYMQRDGASSSFADELARLGELFARPLVFDDRLGPCALGLAVLGTYGAARLGKRHRAQAVVSVLVALVTVLSYYAPELLVVRQFWTLSSGRFLMPVIVALAPLAASFVPARSSMGKALLATFAATTVVQNIAVADIGAFDASREGMAWALSGCLAFALFSWLARRVGRLQVVMTVAALTIALVGLRHLRAALRPRLFDTEFQIAEYPWYWANVARRCDLPTSRPRHIAVTSGPAQNLDNLFAFPLLGSELQNELRYVTPTRDGRIHHFGSPADNARFEASLDRDAWLARLSAHGITHVMSFRPRSRELGWMESMREHFRPLERGASWGFFERIAQPDRAQSTLP